MDYLRRFGSGPRFAVHMFEEDLNRMAYLVLLHPAKETGGNLFGLWTSDGEPVLHVVLGPAIGCTRTEVSFYQSIPYLERVGGLLTKDYQLCHIGEWHSHHRLRLSEPSSGDSSTVIRNYPRGTCGFLLIIANILQNGQVTLSPYLYKEGQRNYEKGEINKLPGQSPFRKVDVILSHILQDEDTSSTVNEQRPRDYWPSSPSGSPRPAEEGEPKHDHVYMFEEDRKMIKGLLHKRGTSEICGEGDLFGLWTSDEEPVLHVVHRPTERKNEQQLIQIHDHPLDKKEEEKKESLSKDYPSLQHIGKYILHPQRVHEADKPTPGEASSIRSQFPNGGVLIVVYTVEEEIGLAAYIYNKGPEPKQNQSLEIKSLSSLKVFSEKQETNEKMEENKAEGDEVNLMDVDPQDPPSPNFDQHLGLNA